MGHHAVHQPVVQAGDGGGRVSQRRDKMLQFPSFWLVQACFLGFPLGGGLHLQMVHKGVEEEGARGEAVGEQLGGGKGVLEQGVDWLGQLLRVGHHRHQWPIEGNHQ